MGFEQNLLAAKAEKRQQLIKVAFILSGVSFLLLLSLLLVNVYQSDDVILDPITQHDVLLEQDDLSINSDALRQEYIDRLSDYENRLKPQLAKIDLNSWDKPRVDQLTMLEDQALVNFSNAEYATAVTNIERVVEQAQAMVDDSRQAFKQALSQAELAYNNDQYDAAQLQISQAMILDNTSTAAIKLADKIAKLPAILSLIDKANTAKVENNYQQELAYLNKIIKQDPQRHTAIKRRQVVITLIANNNFNKAVKQAYQAIAQGDVIHAKKRLKTARNIYPHRAEIAEIDLALQQLLQQQRIAIYQAKVVTAITVDNWELAKEYLILVLQELPNDKPTQALLDKANNIIALNIQIKSHLNKPYRLANKSAKAKANQTINNAEGFVKDSPKLQQASHDLSQLMMKMNRKITVEITSDNQTTILVRGVGIVGKTALKEIELTAGNYTFEGKRKGYKSKLLNVLIPYEQPHYQLTIQCNERI